MIEYFFKFSVVKGRRYLQIWKREDGVEVYVLTAGNPDALYKKLVRLSDLEKLN